MTCPTFNIEKKRQERRKRFQKTKQTKKTNPKQPNNNKINRKRDQKVSLQVYMHSPPPKHMEFSFSEQTK